MKVSYFNPALDMYVVECKPYPVVLASVDNFDNDAYGADEPVAAVLYDLAPEHHCVVKIGDFTYVARRDGVTITLAQVLMFDAHEHADEILGNALDAVIDFAGEHYQTFGKLPGEDYVRK